MPRSLAKNNAVLRFLLENSLFLIFGAAAGLAWANLDHASYEALLHFPLLDNPLIGYAHAGHRVITVHYLVNDMLMALFFAIAGKEVWEATLPGGALNNPKEAATPLIATLGGVVMPALLYVAGAAWLGEMAEFGRGWAVPCATDIAFSYMVARLIFGHRHPAIPFLLLLAIADDAIGLVILAIFYPQEEVRPLWLLLAVAAVGLGFVFRRLRYHSFWPYLLIAGPLSWFGFALAGLHPALGLLPIIPTLPHAHVDTGLFDWRRLERDDSLTAFEAWWKNPVELILGAFGLVNAGVVFSAVGHPTFLVLAGLLLGKPLGIWGFGTIATRWLGFEMPGKMSGRELFVIGCAAAIGFTVALFVATVAFPPGAVQDAAKMGALASFSAAIVTWIAARLCRIEKQGGGASAAH
jgi:Na+:H+ antiporter, NhaA family